MGPNSEGDMMEAIISNKCLPVSHSHIAHHPISHVISLAPSRKMCNAFYVDDRYFTTLVRNGWCKLQMQTAHFEILTVLS